MSKATGFLKPSLDDDFLGSAWKEDKADLVRNENELITVLSQNNLSRKLF
jgi:hypothetical protein